MKKILSSMVLSTLFLLSTDKLPQSVSKVIPKGYSVLKFKKGNLNRDKIADAILILKHDKEEEKEDTKRLLYILVGTKNGDFKVVKKSSSAVLGVQDGGMMGDPFQDVAIKNGYFSVEHYGGSSWRWSRIVTFKYNKSKKNWFLHKDGGDSYHSSEPDKVTTKIKTVKDFGVLSFEKYDIQKE